jgi:hypothetical protein
MAALMIENQAGHPTRSGSLCQALHPRHSSTGEDIKVWRDHVFAGMEMNIVGRTIGLDRNKGDMAKDEEGPALVNVLGQKAAWLMNTLHMAMGAEE